jgi:hypothetical protein
MGSQAESKYAKKSKIDFVLLECILQRCFHDLLHDSVVFSLSFWVECWSYHLLHIRMCIVVWVFSCATFNDEFRNPMPCGTNLLCSSTARNDSLSTMKNLHNINHVHKKNHRQEHGKGERKKKYVVASKANLSNARNQRLNSLFFFLEFTSGNMLVEDDFVRARQMKEAEERSRLSSDPPEHIKGFLSTEDAAKALASLTAFRGWKRVGSKNSPLDHILDSSTLDLYLYDKKARTQASIPEFEELIQNIEKKFSTKCTMAWCYRFAGGKDHLGWHRDMLTQHTFCVSLGVARPIDFRSMFTNVKTSLYPQPGDLLHWAKEFDQFNERAVPTSKFILLDEISLFAIILTEPLPNVKPKSNKPSKAVPSVVTGECSCGGLLGDHFTAPAKVFFCMKSKIQSETIRKCTKCGKKHTQKSQTPTLPVI